MGRTQTLTEPERARGVRVFLGTCLRGLLALMEFLRGFMELIERVLCFFKGFMVFFRRVYLFNKFCRTL